MLVFCAFMSCGVCSDGCELHWEIFPQLGIYCSFSSAFCGIEYKVTSAEAFPFIDALIKSLLCLTTTVKHKILT